MCNCMASLNYFSTTLNSLSNSFSVSSGRIGLETSLFVGVRSSEINWSSLSSRKPCRSFMSCVERLDIMGAVMTVK